MENILKLFGDTAGDEILKRFSTFIGLFVVFYTFFYYYIFTKNVPGLMLVIILMVIHFSQGVFIKYLVNMEMYNVIFLVILVPGLLFLILHKYIEREKLIQKERYTEMLKKLKKIKEMDGPTNLDNLSPKSNYIMTENKTPLYSTQGRTGVIPQKGLQQAPPMAHYMQNDGGAPGQSYAYGMPDNKVDLSSNYQNLNNSFNQQNTMPLLGSAYSSSNYF